MEAIFKQFMQASAKLSACPCAEMQSGHFCTGCCSLTFCDLRSLPSPGLQRVLL